MVAVDCQVASLIRIAGKPARLSDSNRGKQNAGRYTDKSGGMIARLC